MQLTSTAFQHIETIPAQHTADGQNTSPPLMWSGLPTGTVSLALLCEDPDAPASTKDNPFVHWVLFNLGPQNGMLPEGLPKETRLNDPVGCRQGVNSMKELGYNGPAPPVGHGMHRYFFRLYALSKFLALPATATANDLRRDMEGSVLGTAELMGTYERALEKKKTA